MAATVDTYNQVAYLTQSGQLPPASTYKVELLNNSATFTAANTQKTQVDNAGAYEVYGYNWTQGGEALTSVACAIADTNKSNMTAVSPQVTLSGGSLTVYKYIIYCDTLANDPPLYFITLESAQTVTSGNVMGISIPSGIVSTLSIAA